MEKINFKVNGRHSTTTGEATIVNDYNDGLKLASKMFGEQFSTNKIAVVETLDGYFAIYENYADSGSNDYCYFANRCD
jgi:hypothetical protein